MNDGKCAGCSGDATGYVVDFRGMNQIRLRWVNNPFAKAMDQAAQAWLNTKYVPGQCRRGYAVDCRWLMVGLLESVGVPRPQLTKVPVDIAAHNTQAAEISINQLVTYYKAAPVKNQTVQPGDVLVVPGEPGGGASNGHAVIATGTPWRFVHASCGGGVSYTNLANFPTVEHHFRPSKQGWNRSC